MHHGLRAPGRLLPGRRARRHLRGQGRAILFPAGAEEAGAADGAGLESQSGEGGRVTMRERVADLPSVASSVGQARALVRVFGEGLPASMLDDAELLVSELVSNAVRHGGSSIRMSLVSQARSLTVSVFDAGADLPAMRLQEVDRTVASGRGLRMVEQLADDWGVDVDDNGRGKAVWFRLAFVPRDSTDDSTEHNNVRGRAEEHGVDHHAAR